VPLKAGGFFAGSFGLAVKTGVRHLSEYCIDIIFTRPFLQREKNTSAACLLLGDGIVMSRCTGYLVRTPRFFSNINRRLILDRNQGRKENCSTCLLCVRYRDIQATARSYDAAQDLYWRSRCLKERLEATGKESSLPCDFLAPGENQNTRQTLKDWS
jgi:hypothetical protein